MLRFFRIILINSLVGALLFSYLYYSETKGILNYFENPWLIISMVIGANLLGYCILFSNKLIDRFYSWKRGIFYRFILEIGLNFTITIGLIALFFSLYGNFFLKTGLVSIISEYNETTIRIFILSFVTLFIFTIIDFALYSYNQYSVVQIESVKLSREQLILQFDALKSQLSPHYLFNNLNTIYALVHQDVELTEHYIRMLAQTYQYILNRHSEKITPIKEELMLIEAYKYLLEIRFGKTIDISIKLSEDTLKYFIPPLSIQILIENAVKHNTFENDNPLRIEILNDYDYIIVRNNISQATPKTDSLKIGLENLRKRYSYLTEKKVQTIVNNYFIVKIPIIKNQQLTSR